MEMPSLAPPLPELTKPAPKEAPASVMYGRFVNAMSPYGELTPPPLRVASPLSSCQAQNPLVSQPSGLAPCGEMTMYCASRLAAAVVLPKWPAALTASTPSWWPVAEPG